MIPVLIQSLEKAASQSTQSQLVTEAVSAANILVKLSLVDISSGKSLKVLWYPPYFWDTFSKEDNFMTSCLLPWTTKLSKGGYS